jgi:hypothetical protein
MDPPAPKKKVEIAHHSDVTAIVPARIPFLIRVSSSSQVSLRPGLRSLYPSKRIIFSGIIGDANFKIFVLRVASKRHQQSFAAKGLEIHTERS